MLKNTCPKANDAFYLSFVTLEIIIPKQVGAKHAPKNNKNQRPIMKGQGSKRKKRSTPAIDARNAKPQQMTKA